MEYRIEHDSMGEVKVPADKYWAAQTQRSSQNFPIGVGLETMPREITHAFGILKKAAAMANLAFSIATEDENNPNPFKNYKYIYRAYQKVTKENVQTFLEKEE